MINNIFLKNAIWLFSEKILVVIGGLVITIYTGRYLGPSNMGIITYSIAIGTMLLPLAQLGSNTLIFDKSAKKIKTGVFLIFSSQILRHVIFIILSFMVIIYEIFISERGSEELFVIIVILSGFYFNALDSYKPFFDATLRSKTNVIASQIALVVSHLLRLIFVFFSLNFFWFAIPYLINNMISYLFKKRSFDKKYGKIDFTSKNRIKYRQFSISSGIPLALSAFSVAIYVKVSQIFLAEFTNLKDVGLIGAANTLTQGWIFIPITIITVCFSKISGDRKDKSLGFSFVYLICTVVSIIPILLLSFYNYEIIEYTFGLDYIDIAQYLPIMAISSLFVIYGTISYRIIINLNGYGFLMKKMFLVGAFNVLLSFFLIKNFGIEGAIYSVLITEILSATLANYFFKSACIFKYQLNSIVSLKYIKKFKTKKVMA